MQHAFGESTKNIIAHITMGEDVYQLDEIDLKLPRKKIIYKDIADVDKWETPETEDKIKLTVSGVYDDFKALKKTKKYKQLVKSGVKIVFKPSKIKDVKEVLNDDREFPVILDKLINEEKNKYLFKIYQSVVNDKNVDKNDIIYLD